MDLEKGLASSNAQPTTTTSGFPSNTLTSLELFQLFVGIHTPSGFLHSEKSNSSGQSLLGQTSPFGMRSENVGLYRRAKEEERRARVRYLMTSFISNTLYMLQILFAAVFTALSAYKDTHAVVLTSLGAVNTVVAGALAWQKGQGVPQRYRKARDQYQHIILDIDMTERAFLDNEHGLDPCTEKDRLQKLFDVAQADQQANYPDLYVSTGAK